MYPGIADIEGGGRGIFNNICPSTTPELTNKEVYSSCDVANMSNALIFSVSLPPSDLRCAHMHYAVSLTLQRHFLPCRYIANAFICSVSDIANGQICSVATSQPTLGVSAYPTA